MTIIESRRNYEDNTYSIVFDQSNVYLDQELEDGEFIPGRWVIKDSETQIVLARIDLRPL